MTEPEPPRWTIRLGVMAGFQVGSTPRRALDLPGTSARRIWPLVGTEIEAGFGPFRLEFAPRVEDRLLDDPDWSVRQRGDDQGLALRTPSARLVAEWRWASLEIGEVERNWGPQGVPGLLISPLGYSRPGFGFAIGPERLRFQWRTERLSNEPDSETGDDAPRWLTVHRLRWRPSRRWEVSAWEAMVTSEADGIDAARLNPFALYNFGRQFGIGDERNASFGFDVAWEAARDLWLETQVLVDDIVIWNAEANPYPHRFGFTLQLRHLAADALAWRAWATGLSSLALNTFDPAEAFLDDRTGTGRLRPDHLAAGTGLSLWLGRGAHRPTPAKGPAPRGTRERAVQDTWRALGADDGWMPSPHPDPVSPDEPSPRLGALPGRARLELGLRWRRQGPRRFTDPFPEFGGNPTPSDLPAFSREMEREVLALHLALDWRLGSLSLKGDSQLQRRRFPASGAQEEWGVEARAQLVWRLGDWSYKGR